MQDHVRWRAGQIRARAASSLRSTVLPTRCARMLVLRQPATREVRWRAGLARAGVEARDTRGEVEAGCELVPPQQRRLQLLGRLPQCPAAAAATPSSKLCFAVRPPPLPRSPAAGTARRPAATSGTTRPRPQSCTALSSYNPAPNTTSVSKEKAVACSPNVIGRGPSKNSVPGCLKYACHFAVPSCRVTRSATPS